MKDFTNELREQLNYLTELSSEITARLRNEQNLPKESVFVNKTKNSYQYYFKRSNGKKQYIRVKDYDLVRKYLQIDYDKDVLKKVKHAQSALTRFLKNYDFHAVEKVYANMNTGRKLMIKPICLSDEEYIREWMIKHPGNMNTYPKEGVYITDNGESVRSKSEKILADMFYRLGVTYSYEPALELSNGRTIYPDFAVLNVKQRKTIYWEHFGLITDGEYAVKAMKKLSLYENFGLSVGQEILFSTESSDMPLNTRQIERMIHEKLLR